METFFIADTHIGHANCIIHERRPQYRPEDINSKGLFISDEIKQLRCTEMDEWIRSTWNSTIGPKDKVYIIGDFIWKRHRYWINELNGQKIMLIGSHDKMPLDCLEMFKSPEVTVEDHTKVHGTFAQFSEVHSQLVRKICRQDMHLNHWPLATWQGKCYDSWHLCGHSHGRFRPSRPGEIGMGLMLDVGWDIWKRPLHFEEVRTEMEKKKELLRRQRPVYKFENGEEL